MADRSADPTTGGTSVSRSAVKDDTASDLSLKSGHAGPFAREADSNGVDPGTNFGRDAAMVGGGAAAAGAGAYAYSNDKPKQEHPSTTTTTTTTTSQHPQPLADTSAAASSHINPVGAPETTSSQAGESHLGRDAAIAGGAGLAGGAAASQLNRPRDDVADATYTERSQPLGGSSGSYNPDPDRAMGTGPIDTGFASTGSQQTGVGQTSTGRGHVNPIGAPEESLDGQRRLGGEDAALAGGVGAAGIAAGSGTTQLNKAPDDVQQATYTDRSYHVGGMCTLRHGRNLFEKGLTYYARPTPNGDCKQAGPAFAWRIPSGRKTTPLHERKP